MYPAPCACAQCGGARLRKLDDVVSRSLECEPRRWKIVEHVRETMTCRDCEGVTETPAPSHPIPRGFAGPNLLASMLVSKFMLHQPLNRQSDAFAREGIAIATSTLADRVGACAVALAPIVDAIRRHVLAADRTHGDDTTVPVLAKAKTDTGRLWTYVRDDRPFGGAAPPAAAFRYSRSRSGEHPREHLASYGGILQADAYAGYNDLYDGRRRPAPVIEAACWAHGRRKLFDIAKLTKAPIAVERTINGRSPAERVAARQQQSKPLVLDLEIYLREQRMLLSAKSDTAEGITYILSRWVAFTRFLDDGRTFLSNNAAERALRGIAIGRRNWTFCGSDAGGHRAAAIYTLIETAKLNDVDPQVWLADVLARLPDHPSKRLHELLPWNWKISRPASALAQAAWRTTDEDLRVAMLRTHLRDHLADADLSLVGVATDRATGADLMALVQAERRRARVARRPMTVGDPVAVAIPVSTVPDAVDCRCALHEAGHAVVASILDLQIDSLSLVRTRLVGGRMGLHPNGRRHPQPWLRGEPGAVTARGHGRPATCNVLDGDHVGTDLLEQRVEPLQKTRGNSPHV